VFYQGQWASDIFSRYGCFIHIFEPVKEFSNNIEQRFSNNKKIIVHNFGLSNETKNVKLNIDKDSSSVYKKGNNICQISFIEAMKFFKEMKLDKIDLMKINIEGGEYDLLEHLINVGFIKRINNIQVQFHDFVPNAKNRMRRIQNNLKRTHQLTYQYQFVWENWQLLKR